MENLASKCKLMLEIRNTQKIPDNESLDHYLTRIRAKNNTPITEEEWMQECQREDAL